MLLEGNDELLALDVDALSPLFVRLVSTTLASRSPVASLESGVSLVTVSLVPWELCACKSGDGVSVNVVLPVFLLVVECFSPQSVHHSPLLSVLGGSTRVNQVVASV